MSATDNLTHAAYVRSELIAAMGEFYVRARVALDAADLEAIFEDLLTDGDLVRVGADEEAGLSVYSARVDSADPFVASLAAWSEARTAKHLGVAA